MCNMPMHAGACGALCGPFRPPLGAARRRGARWVSGVPRLSWVGWLWGGYRAASRSETPLLRRAREGATLAIFPEKRPLSGKELLDLDSSPSYNGPSLPVFGPFPYDQSVTDPWRKSPRPRTQPR